MSPPPASASSGPSSLPVALPPPLDIEPLFQRLPPRLLVALASVGVRCCRDLQQSPQAIIDTVLSQPLLGNFADLIGSFRVTSPDAFSICRLSLAAPRDYAAHLSALVDGPAAQCSSGRPAANLRLLTSASARGISPQALCDYVADARASHSVAPSSAATYDSHLKQIRRSLDILGEIALPAKLVTIRRVPSVVGNPSTLRGWLAARRRLHCFARMPWLGDRDPFLLAVRVCLRRSSGPTLLRPRCRRPLLRRVAALATRSAAWEVGGLAVLAYTFGLRVPSELVRQATAQKFLVKVDRISYGPLRRKAQQHMQTLTRWCVCRSDPLLCAHSWLSILVDARPLGPLFSKSLPQLMREFSELLAELGVERPNDYTSHCFRRGGAIDTLEAHGLRAMLDFGQWHSPQAADAYATRDEQTARALASALAEFSDDDS